MLLPYSGKSAGRKELGRRRGVLPGLGTGSSGAAGALAGAGAVSPSSGEGSWGGWEAAAICRLHEK